jgi:hypothetical protein
MNKIQGFGLIRGTAVLRLVLNASPFFCGQLIMSYIPNYYAFSTDAAFVAMQRPTSGGLAILASVTQKPHVVICCDNSAAELRIPYIAPYDWFEMKQQTYDWGRAYVDVLSPLLTGAANAESTVEYSLYLYFEDVELAAPMVTQSSSSGKSRARKKGGGKTLLDKELDTSRTVSNSLLALSKASSALGAIPVIGEVLGAPAWALAAAAKGAAAMGWSKPVSEDSVTPKFEQGNKFGAVSDGVDMSVPLGMSATNKVRISDEFTVYSGDEMSMDFLLRREALIGTFAFTTSNASADVLYSLNMAPQNLFYSAFTKGPIGGHSAIYGVGPPVCYLSKMFQYWRGSLKLRLVFVKTKFHTGRVEITYTPSYDAGTYPSLTTSIVALREIVDLKTGEAIEVTLPYMLAVPWLTTQYASSAPVHHMGRFQVRCLNELRVPEATATNTVNVLVYASAGPDLEFAGPTTNPSGITGTANNMLAFSPQMGCETLIEGEIVNAGAIGGNDYAEYCFGEKVTSIKQLLNRNQVITSTVTPYGTTPSCIRWWLWKTAILSMNASTGALQGDPSFGGDVYAYVRPMYAYFRGSVRCSTWNNGGVGFKSITCDPSLLGGAALSYATAPYVSMITTNPWLPTGSVTTSGAVSVYHNAANLNDPVKVPYYCPTKMSLCYNPSTNIVPNEPSQPTTFLYTGCYANSTGGIALRSFADDFQLAFFLGCPPFFISYS